MKPEKIILFRHGESEGNVDKNVYNEKPDYALNLTEQGLSQAKVAGEQLVKLIGSNKSEEVFFYVSPLFRTRQTFEQIAKSFDGKVNYREEPRLREQEWGHLKSTDDCKAIDIARDSYGPFYYRIPDGESAADVYDRISDFMSTLYRDFDKVDYPKNTVLVLHGMSLRLFLMRWFHWTVEEFEKLENPENCKMVVLSLNKQTNKYELNSLLKIKNPIHNFQSPIKI